jgi:ssDNA thymidine ADP-ribosyltransferase, DarT
MAPPVPTPIFRLVHIEDLDVLLRRGGLHAPKHTPNDGLPYRTIHNVDIQTERRVRPIPCGPGGTIHDYVSFYFGYLSPMLLQLKTGRVAGYQEGQEPLIYLVASVQTVVEEGVPFVFSDGHGIAAFTSWYSDVAALDKVDWDMVYQRYWADSVDDMDRQRRKQSEFMLQRFCPWTLVEQIAVVNSKTKAQVESVMSQFDVSLRRDVIVRSGWYY